MNFAPAAVLLNISSILETIAQIVTAGVAIVAMALLMYALGFSYRDRLVQAFGIILLTVTVIYTSEALANVSTDAPIIRLFLQLKWAALVLLPAAYLHFSDQLLTMTGRPSRGRRSRVVLLVYAVSLVGILLIPFGLTVGRLAATTSPVPYLERTIFTFLFGMFYIVVMLTASVNLGRAILRSRTDTARRRLMYLFAGASTPAITSVVFLFHGNNFFAQHPDLFFIATTIAGLITGVFLVVMAYVVSFFGMTWTDRAIKSRLFRWLLRGPMVAAITLGLVTVIRRYGQTLGNPYIALVPIAMVATILILEYGITLLAPRLEKPLFFGADREDLDKIRGLEERMLTHNDLNQLLETIAASICDRLQVEGAFIAVLKGSRVDYIVLTGKKQILPASGDLGMLRQLNENAEDDAWLVHDENLYLLPLWFKAEDQGRLLGFCGIPRDAEASIDESARRDIEWLLARAEMALKDRFLQQQVLDSMAVLQAEVDYIQELRASSSYDQKEIYQAKDPEVSPQMTEWVKDALTHYWGGPKFTKNPLLDLKVVEEASDELDGNRTNALRAVLKNAIERVRPEGERKFTGDWLLYNILDLKFLQGKRVREVAHKLAVSEADLYRKQRVALESVAANILRLEMDSVSQANHGAEREQDPD